MKLTLDVENTVTHRDGKLHLDPFETDNKLVMIGCLTDNGKEQLFHMDDLDDNLYSITRVRSNIQELLDQATILIGHNIVHDLVWLWECGFVYDGNVFDTMLAEYVLQRGQKNPLSLELCAQRYELATQKQDTLKEYLNRGVSVADIPKEELSEYLNADLHATKQLYDRIVTRLNSEQDSGLLNTIHLTNRVACVLARMYHRGFKVNRDELLKVKQEF